MWACAIFRLAKNAQRYALDSQQRRVNVIGVWTWALPKRAVAAAVAAIVLATTLVVAPLPVDVPLVQEVPVVGDLVADTPASAHTQTACYQQAYVYYPNASGLGRPGEPEIGYRTVCYNVAHSHFWSNLFYGITTTGGCAVAGVIATPAVGLGCGMLFAGAGALANR